MRLFFWIVLMTAAPMTALAQQPDPAQIEALERQQKAAEQDRAALDAKRESARGEIARLQGELVKLGAEVETYENAARAADARLGALLKDEAALNAQIFKNRADLYTLLAALQRIDRNPPPALATHPDDARSAAQAALLIATMTQRVSDKAQLLTRQLDTLQEVRAEIGTQKQRLAETELKLREKRGQITALIKEKKTQEATLGEQSNAAQKRADQYAREAKSLRELIANLEADADVTPRVKPDSGAGQSGQITPHGIPVPQLKPSRESAPEPLVLPDTLRFADARGKLRPPARGRLVYKFNQSLSGGEKAKGVTVSTRSGAQVLAPFSGRIEFDGAFKNYSRVVILNVGDGYFIVLTGMAESFGEKGQNVVAGEPLGRMGEDGAQLYIEFRKSGTPIDPLPWLGSNFG